MIHYLKIWVEHYERVKEGTKTFEIRVNDRAFQKGDYVCLKAFDHRHDVYYPLDEKPSLHFKVGDVYPIDDKRVAFSLLTVEDQQWPMN